MIENRLEEKKIVAVEQVLSKLYAATFSFHAFICFICCELRLKPAEAERLIVSPFHFWVIFGVRFARTDKSLLIYDERSRHK